MTTDNICYYLQNRIIQTSQTGGQQYSDTSPPLVFSDHSYTRPFHRQGMFLMNLHAPLPHTGPISKA